MENQPNCASSGCELPALFGDFCCRPCAGGQVRRGEAPHECVQPAVPAVPEPRRLIAVGGSLHGMIVLVPFGCTAVYTDNGGSVDVDLIGLGERPAAAGPKVLPAFRAASRFELYRVQFRGWVGLLISAQLLGTADKPRGLDQTIVEALGIAAGVWWEAGPPLVDLDELRKA